MTRSTYKTTRTLSDLIAHSCKSPLERVIDMTPAASLETHPALIQHHQCPISLGLRLRHTDRPSSAPRRFSYAKSDNDPGGRAT